MNTLAIQETFSNFSNQFRSWWETLLSHLPELLLALVIMCLSYFLSRFAYRMTHRVVSNKVDQKSVGRLISKTVSALIILAGLFMALQVVNLGNDAEISMLELVQTIGQVLGRSLEIIHCPLPQDDPVRRRPDLTRARERLGYRPTVSLKEGLEQTVAYFSRVLGL